MEVGGEDHVSDEKEEEYVLLPGSKKRKARKNLETTLPPRSHASCPFTTAPIADAESLAEAQFKHRLAILHKALPLIKDGIITFPLFGIDIQADITTRTVFTGGLLKFLCRPNIRSRLPQGKEITKQILSFVPKDKRIVLKNHFPSV